MSTIKIVTALLVCFHLCSSSFRPIYNSDPLLPTVSVFAQGTSMMVGKGMTNLNVSVYAQSQIKNAGMWESGVSMYINHPGDCFKVFKDFKEGAKTLTTQAYCLIYGPINENMTIKVFAHSWANYYEGTDMRQVYASD